MRASDEARRGLNPDGEQTLYRDAVIRQGALQALVFECRERLDAAHPAVDGGRKRQ